MRFKFTNYMKWRNAQEIKVTNSLCAFFRSTNFWLCKLHWEHTITHAETIFLDKGETDSAWLANFYQSSSLLDHCSIFFMIFFFLNRFHHHRIINNIIKFYIMFIYWISQMIKNFTGCKHTIFRYTCGHWILILNNMGRI